MIRMLTPARHIFASCIAVALMFASFTAVVTVPAQPAFAAVPVLA